MKLKTIAATYGRKLNMGDYNSANVEITLWADLDEGEDELEATLALRQMARQHVMAETARLSPAIKTKVEQVFAGLPVEIATKLLEE